MTISLPTSNKTEITSGATVRNLTTTRNKANPFFFWKKDFQEKKWREANLLHLFDFERVGYIFVISEDLQPLQLMVHRKQHLPILQGEGASRVRRRTYYGQCVRRIVLKEEAKFVSTTIVLIKLKENLG